MKYLKRFYELYESIQQTSFEGIVYHGSDKIFTQFDIDPNTGVFFSADMEYAHEYGDKIYVCRVVLNNPILYTEAESESDMEIDRIELIAKGYDGRIINYNNGEADVIAFYPQQIEIVKILNDSTKL